MPTPPTDSNFVYSGASLPANKVNANPNPGPTDEYWDAITDANFSYGALGDIRSQILSEWNLVAYGGDPTGGADCAGALIAACAAIESAGGGILKLPQGVYSLQSNVACPASVTLLFQNSILNIANGVTLTINGTIAAPPVQVFRYTSNPSVQAVAMGASPQRLNVKWFGAAGDGVTDDAPAFKQCLLAQFTQGQAFPTAAFGAESVITEITIPSGNYVINETIELAAARSLRGEGRVLLQTDQDIPILRIWPFKTRVSNIVFVGGQSAIALGGLSTYYPGAYFTNAAGNIPVEIDRVVFYYQTGPSIWADMGPVANAAASPPSVPMSNATIPFVSLPANFPVSGTILTDGCSAPITYTGKSGNNLTGCTGGGTGAITVGGISGLEGIYGPGQYCLRVTNFEHSGACLFWGGSDLCSFENGHSAGDFTTPPLDGNGEPLGLFNTYDTFTLINFQCDTNGTINARQAAIVGAGQISLESCSFGQNAIGPLVRQRVATNTYLGKRLSGPILNVPAEAGEQIELDVHNCYLGDCATFFLVEAYEALPTSISFRGIRGADSFLTVGLLWLDKASVALPNGSSGQGQDTLRLHYENLITPINLGYLPGIWTGFDPGSAAAPTQITSEDVTDVFVGLTDGMFLSTVEASSIPESENLIANGAIDNTGVFSGGIWSLGAVDNSTGIFGLTSRTGYRTGGWEVALNDGFIGFSSSTPPAGVYTFSIYVKVNYACLLVFTLGPTGAVAQLNTRRLHPADTFQRLEVPFYYPGSGSLIANVICASMAQAITAWATNTVTAVGNQVVNGGKVYQCVAVTGDAETASSGGGPSATGPANITDNHVTWTYVGTGAAFTPSTNVGLWMINKGSKAAPYSFPSNADSAQAFGWVPRIFYGTAAPTSGQWFIGDQLLNTVPAPGGVIGWVCTTAGTPGTWKAFGQISE